MNFHLQRDHPVEYALDKYGCDSCQEGFEDADTLNEHMLKEVRITACFFKFCGFVFIFILIFSELIFIDTHFCLSSTMMTHMGLKSVAFVRRC